MNRLTGGSIGIRSFETLTGDDISGNEEQFNTGGYKHSQKKTPPKEPCHFMRNGPAYRIPGIRFTSGATPAMICWKQRRASLSCRRPLFTMWSNSSPPETYSWGGVRQIPPVDLNSSHLCRGGTRLGGKHRGAAVRSKN